MHRHPRTHWSSTEQERRRNGRKALTGGVTVQNGIVVDVGKVDGEATRAIDTVTHDLHSVTESDRFRSQMELKRPDGFL